MDVEMQVGPRRVPIEIDLPPENVWVARSKNSKPTRSIESTVEEALARPIGTDRLCQYRLSGKKVVILVDDRTRPTPTKRIIPYVLTELRAAGVKDEDITFVTASGEHMPMTEEEMPEKVGAEIAEKYPVVAHDAFDRDHMDFLGFSKFGTPIWVNQTVTSADFKMSIGRIAPHWNFGYAGGAKIILPGVCATETIVRNHAMFMSSNGGVGALDEHPCRMDAEDVARIVGLDFILNVVLNHEREVCWAVAGHYIAAHRAGVAFGDEHLWGAAIPQKADITIASPGAAWKDGSAYDRLALNAAFLGTRSGGLIFLLRGDGEAETDGPASRFDTWSLEEVVLDHERADLPLKGRELSRYRRDIWGEHRRRRAAYETHVTLVGGKVSERLLKQLSMHHVASLDGTLEEAIRRYGRGPRMLVLPDAPSTLPLERLHR